MKTEQTPPAHRDRQTLPLTSEARAKAASIREAIIQDLKANPTESLQTLAKRHGASYDTAAKVRRKFEQGNDQRDRSEVWGDLLSKAVPLRMRAKVMRDLVRSNNPVAASRALEMVLESDGLRKKLPEPKVQSTIIVQATDDVGFE